MFGVLQAKTSLKPILYIYLKVKTFKLTKSRVTVAYKVET